MPVVRTRFAPSPTGALHVGGVRTALFCYLYARHFGGQLILRIEDTDRERSTEQSVSEILAALRWLELDWDEGPFFQTQRSAIYRDAVDQLLKAGRAYPCTCLPAELEEKRRHAMASGARPAYDRHCRPGFGPGPDPTRPAAIRFATPPEGETIIHDLVKGDVVFNNTEVEDLVVQRSDGTPTYNLCVAVDDADMHITHVIRGDDHLANTPKQILIYQALGTPVPSFAHLPQVLGMDRARLSKRHAATAVVSYRELGYFPEALLNFLARLGWSHGDQEIFSRRQLIEAFSLDNVGKSAGVFNLEKLDWLNAQYLKARRPEQLAAELREFLSARGEPIPGDDAWLSRMASTLRERARTLVEIAELGHFFLHEELVLDPKANAKFIRPESALLLEAVTAELAQLADWSAAAIEAAFTRVLERTGKTLGALAQPVRVAVTGGSVSPGIHEVLEVLGRARSLARLQAAISRASSAAPDTPPSPASP